MQTITVTRIASRAIFFVGIVREDNPDTVAGWVTFWIIGGLRLSQKGWGWLLVAISHPRLTPSQLRRRISYAKIVTNFPILSSLWRHLDDNPASVLGTGEAESQRTPFPPNGS